MAIECSFSRAILEFIYLLKSAQQSKKGSGFVTPKENINRISAVDKEHFLGFLKKRAGCATPKENIVFRISAVDEEHFWFSVDSTLNLGDTG